MDQSASIKVPLSLKTVFVQKMDKSGNIPREVAVSKYQALDFGERELTILVQSRVEHLLSFVKPESILSNSPLLQQYEEALSVNKKGYSSLLPERC